MARKRELKIFYGYVIVIVSFFIYLLLLGTLSTFGVFFKPISNEFGWTRAMTSGAHSLCFFMYGLLSFVTGRLSDKFGPRAVVTTCGLLAGSGYLLMSQINTIWQLYLFYGIMVGIGVAGNFTPLASTIAKWFIKRRATMIAISSTGFGMGVIIMPTVATQLISTYGWRTSYIVIGTLVLVISISGAQFLLQNPGQMGELPDGEKIEWTNKSNVEARGFYLQEAIHTGQLWMVSIIWMCSGLWGTTIMLHIVPYVTDLGFSVTNAANVLVITGVAHIIGRITMGIVGDRVGNKLAFVISLILVIASLFWLQIARRLWMLYVFAAMFGFSNYGLAAVMSVLVADLFGVCSLGAILGIIVVSFGVGALIGPTLAGRIFDTTGSYQLAFWGCITVAIIALILTLLLRPIRR